MAVRRAEAIDKCTSKGLSRDMCASAAERAARMADAVRPSEWVADGAAGSLPQSTPRFDLETKVAQCWAEAIKKCTSKGLGRDVCASSEERAAREVGGVAKCWAEAIEKCTSKGLSRDMCTSIAERTAEKLHKPSNWVADGAAGSMQKTTAKFELETKVARCWAAAIKKCTSKGLSREICASVRFRQPQATSAEERAARQVGGVAKCWAEAIEKCKAKGVSDGKCVSIAEHEAEKVHGRERSHRVADRAADSMQQATFSPGAQRAFVKGAERAAERAFVEKTAESAFKAQIEGDGGFTAEHAETEKDFQSRLDEISRQLEAEGRGMTQAEAKEIAQRFAIEVTKQQQIAMASATPASMERQPEVRPAADMWRDHRSADKDVFIEDMGRALDALKNRLSP